MATKIANSEYVDYDGKAKISLDKLKVRIHYGPDSKLQEISLDKLFVRGRDKKARPVKSYAEFVRELKKDNVFTSNSLMQKITHGLTDKPSVIVQGIHVPESFNSTIIDAQDAIVSYGVRRNLKVEQAPSTVPQEDLYYYAEIDGNPEFLMLSSIYFYDKANRKRLLSEYTGSYDDLKDIQLFTEDGSKISMLYTENQYVFPSINDYDDYDFYAQKKAVYKRDEATETYQIDKETEQPIDRYFSERTYVKREIDDVDKPGEKKEVSAIKIRNFAYNPYGEYCLLNVNGENQIVSLKNLVDENGVRIADDSGNISIPLSNLVGKKVSIIDGETVIAEVGPLTYQQANMTYSAIKTHQETDKAPDENTYLRLKNGEYVKEDDLQPIAYKLAEEDSDDYDAFLIKTTDTNGNEKFVVLTKDYFVKHGDRTEYKQENAIKIQRCDFYSKDCCVVQTTSKGKEVEQCSIVKKIKHSTAEIATDAKDIALEGFIAAYAMGEYLVRDVYKDGECKELSARGQRYELTDTAYLEDYADSYQQFNSLTTNDIRIENGRIIGGPHYDLAKGIKKSYKTLGNIFKKSFGWVMAGGILTITIGGPVFAAAYMAGMVAAIPAIPIGNLIYGAVKNHQRNKFADKEEANRKELVKSLEERIKKLYEKQLSSEYFSESRFEDEYSKLVNDILSLSSCSIASELHIENGVGKVTPANANAAREYIYEFNEVADKIRAIQKKLRKAEANFKPLDAKLKQIEDDGRVPDDKFLAKYNEAKKAYDDVNSEYSALLERQDSLLNYHGNPTAVETHADRDRLLKLAEVMRIAVYFKTFKDNEIVKEAVAGLEDCSDILTASDIVGAEITADDLGLTEEELSKLSADEINSLIEAKKLEQINPSDLMLTKKKKQNAEFAAKTIEEKITILRKLVAERSMNMLNNMELDFENGLLVDGMGVGLSDEQMSRIPGYSRGYEWAKVKQAIEYLRRELAPEMPIEITFEELVFEEYEEDFEVKPINPLIHATINPDREAETNPDDEETEPKPEKNKPAKKPQLYDARIVSEDSLVELLKAKPESKKRQKLIAEIEKRAGISITEEDIKATIKRIDSKHNPAKGERKSATAGAQALKNKNIYNILVYGQQYLTEYAQEIKQRTQNPHSI